MMKGDVLSEVALDLVRVAGELVGADELVSADELESVCPDCARAVRAGEMTVTRRELTEAMRDSSKWAKKAGDTFGDYGDFMAGLGKDWEDELERAIVGRVGAVDWDTWVIPDGDHRLELSAIGDDDPGREGELEDPLEILVEFISKGHSTVRVELMFFGAHHTQEDWAGFGPGDKIKKAIKWISDTADKMLGNDQQYIY